MFNKQANRAICIITLCISLILPVNVFSSNSEVATNNSWNERQGKFVIENGIIKGDEKGDYSWNSYVKRGDMALMIFRAFNFSSTSGDSFTDVDPESYYYDAITTARALGIAKGDGENFNPEDNVTLGEAILLVQRSVVVAAAYNNDAIKRQVNLNDLYLGENLSKNALRKDIANMLFYFLSNDFTYSQSVGLNSINYYTSKNTSLQFDAKDFSDKFTEISGGEKYFVMLDLPAPSVGVLFYDYKLSNSHNTLVTSDKKFFPNIENNPNISKITFVPSKDFTGTVTIGYTACDGEGSSYNGKIVINVEDNDSAITTINYTVSSKSIKTFEVKDFSEAFKAVSDQELSYVMFSLPSYSFGKLYYDYNTSVPELSASVTNGTKYYADSRNGMVLSKVAFVSNSTYTGSVVIDYTAYDKDNNLYKGKIIIDVE